MPFISFVMSELHIMFSCHIVCLVTCFIFMSYVMSSCHEYDYVIVFHDNVATIVHSTIMHHTVMHYTKLCNRTLHDNAI